MFLWLVLMYRISIFSKEILRKMHTFQIIKPVYIQTKYPTLNLPSNDTIFKIQETLKEKWQNYTTKKVDLFVRSNLEHGEFELNYLFQSIQIFWPKTIGKIILVLDDNDDFNQLPFFYLNDFLIHVYFEPKLQNVHGRIANQLTYLNVHKYTNADYVVTIDSDCFLFLPVTPSLLFNEKNQIKLPFSKTFQADVPWGECQKKITGLDYKKYGHPMITQPIMFKVKTFENYKNWFFNNHSKLSYDDFLNQTLLNNPEELKKCMGPFCWMCQLSIYATHFEPENYQFIQTDEQTTQVDYLRFNAHVAYERFCLNKQTDRECYIYTTQTLLDESIRFLNHERNLKFIPGLFFNYVGVDLFPKVKQDIKAKKLDAYLKSLDIE